MKDKNLIIGLHGLDMKVAYKRELKLIYNIISIAYIREALKTEESASVKNMFIADEAQFLVPRILQKVVVTDTWITTDFATRLRKRGESLVIISQSSANIEDVIRKNSPNLFVFRLIDPQDIKSVSGMFGYVHIDEINYLATMISGMEGKCTLVKTPSSINPFVVITLDVELPRIDETRLEKCMPKTEGEEESLSEDEQALVKSITENPFLNNTERALALGWRKTKYSEVRKSLARKQRTEEIIFKTSVKGAPLVPKLKSL